MTDKEKADEISEHYATSHYFPNDEELAAYNAAIQMAKWKKQQMIDKAIEWLSLNAELYGGFNPGKLVEMVEKFRNAMEE